MKKQAQTAPLSDEAMTPAKGGMIRRSRYLGRHYLSRCAAAWPPIERLLRESWSIASELRSQPGTDAARLACPAEESSEPPWVLCIDDDASYSLALKCRLESHGVAVVRAFEGMEGFRSAFARPADVILLDYDLPDGQGDYVLRRLKDNPVTKPLPVLVITGHRNRELERRMFALGAAGFMNKPLEFSELLAELSKHISILPRAVLECARSESWTPTFPYGSNPNPLEAQ